MGSLVSLLFHTQDIKAKTDLTGGQVTAGIFGILVLLGVAVLSPVWYVMKMEPVDSTYLENPSCEIQSFGWLQLGMGNGAVNLQYDGEKIASVLDVCEDGTEFDWVLWTVEEARVIMWGSGATGLWARINTGAMSHQGGALSWVGIWCVNTFEHGRPLEVQISPMSNALERRDVTFIQETSNGRAECTIDADTLATTAVDSVKNVHSSKEYCKSVASKIPVVCHTFDWAGCVAFMLSTWGFVISVFNVCIKRPVYIESHEICSKAGEA